MTRPDHHDARRPARAWLFGLLLGAIAGAATIYLIANPPLNGVLAGTVAPAGN